MTVSTEELWRERLADLSSSQRDRLQGGNLSQRFSKLPLWANHPAYVGGFYGILLAIALAAPVGYKTNWEANNWGITWLFTLLLLVFATSFLGMASRVMNAMFRRPPIDVPRRVLFVTPFVGIFWMTLELTNLLNVSSTGPWLLMLLPGPLYVHLTWAPRWRMMSMLESGENPFADLNLDESPDNDLAKGDKEIIDVVDSIESEPITKGSEEE